MLVNEGEVAAVASGVSLDEFGEGPIESNLRDPSWLAEKARAHDRVLATAVGRTTIVPFRFGAIYRSEEQIRDLLRERTDLSATLGRLEGAIEFGVKAFVDRAVLRERLAAVGGPAGEPASTGRAYMQRRQLERRLDEDVTLTGDITLSVAGVDLVYVGLRLLLASVGTLERLESEHT